MYFGRVIIVLLGRGRVGKEIDVEPNLYVTMVWAVFWDAYHTKHRCRRRHWRKMTDGFYQLWETYRTQNQAGSQMTIGSEWFGGKNKMFVDVGEGLPTNAEISKIWEIRGQSGQCWSFPGPESQESKIVCIFFPRSIWSLGVPPFDPGEKSWSAMRKQILKKNRNENFEENNFMKKCW